VPPLPALPPLARPPVLAPLSLARVPPLNAPPIPLTPPAESSPPDPAPPPPTRPASAHPPLASWRAAPPWSVDEQARPSVDEARIASQGVILGCIMLKRAVMVPPVFIWAWVSFTRFANTPG